MSLRLPRSNEFYGVPAGLALSYAASYSTADVFSNARINFPILRHLAPVLFYVHILESLLAGFRSRAQNQSLPETLKWMAATMIWGFASLAQQKKAYSKKL